MIVHVIAHSIAISLFVCVMMLLVDYVNVLSRGRMSKLMQGGQFRQYLGASLFGSAPGCLGAFLSVTFYVRGLISFGAIVACMIATSGDEAFVMLAMFPKTALLLFLLLFLAGLIFGWISDYLARQLRIEPCRSCALAKFHFENEQCHCFDRGIWRRPIKLSPMRVFSLLSFSAAIVAVGLGLIGPDAWNWMRVTLFTLLFLTLGLVATVPEHFLREHILRHIVRAHLWRVFLWTFGALLITELGTQYWNLDAFIQNHLGIVFILAAGLGIIPESGPHFIFVMLFASGTIPFSVLFVSSFVQDGHGMLPLLSYSVRDALLIKAFNLAFGLSLGGFLYLVGM